MDKIYHYTSEANWKQVESSGLLLPESSDLLYPMREQHKDRTRLRRRFRDFRDKTFLVGIPEPQHKGWVEYGLMRFLLEKTSGEVLLEVPIFDESRELGFVREHKYLTPKYVSEHYKELSEPEYGELFIEAVLFSSLASPVYIEEDKADPWYAIREELSREVNKSIVKLSEYKGEYEVPEIWVYQATPVRYMHRLKSPTLGAHPVKCA